MRYSFSPFLCLYFAVISPVDSSRFRVIRYLVADFDLPMKTLLPLRVFSRTLVLSRGHQNRYILARNSPFRHILAI